jgi:hypothetical protein
VAHYRLCTHNVNEDLQRGHISYSGIRDDPDEGHIAINEGSPPQPKQSKLAVRFWHTHLQLVQIPPDCTIKSMLQTDMHISTAQRVMAPYGKVLFDDSFADPGTGGMWHCSVEEVLRSVHRAHGQAAAETGLSTSRSFPLGAPSTTIQKFRNRPVLPPLPAYLDNCVGAHLPSGQTAPILVHCRHRAYCCYNNENRALDSC